MECLHGILCTLYRGNRPWLLAEVTSSAACVTLLLTITNPRLKVATRIIGL